MTTLVPELELKHSAVDHWTDRYKVKPSKLGKSYDIFDLVGRNEYAYTQQSSDSDTDTFIIPQAHGSLVENSGLATFSQLDKVCYI